MTALIDDADEALVRAKGPWHALGGNRPPCAAHRSGSRVHGRGVILMHRVIMGARPGEQVDHINGNRMDNRRSNLRICTAAQNKWNGSRHRDNVSGYKGVWFDRWARRWRAKICCHGKQFALGNYRTPQEAALAYNRAASRYFGAFARLNVLEPPAVGKSGG